MKRKAMIFAAGLGTRLRPLTDNKPKALIEIGSTPHLLGIILKKLTSQGFTDIIINIHHFGEQIIEYISKNNFGASISISDERDLLLDTGGGLKKAAWFFNDGQPFLVHNVDVLCDSDLNTLYDYHLQHRPLVTLSAKDRITSRSLLVNNSNELCGWRSNQTGELKHMRGNLKELRPIAYDGVQIVNPALFEKITEEGVFSITDLYLRLCKTEKILVYQHDKFWLDMGKKENFEEAEKHIKNTPGK
jgi:NDP-sugar pyrophosphorylase family protein